MQKSIEYIRYKEIVESLNDMIYELDADGKFTYANKALTAVSKFSKAELNKFHFWELVRKDKLEELQLFYQKQRKKLIKNTYFEFPMVNKDGAEIWVGQNVTMIYSKSKVVTVRAVARNISKIKSLEKDIEHKDRKLLSTTKILDHTKNVLDEKTMLLENIVNEMAEAVVVVSTKGEFLLFNKAAEKMFGEGKADISPTEWNKHYGIYHLDKKTLIKPDELPILKALQGIDTDYINVYVKNKFKRKGIFIRSSNKTLYNKNGEIIGALAVGIDVTQDHLQKQKIANSEEKFRAMSDASPLGIFVTNKKGSCTYTNAEYHRISGLTLKETLGNGWTSAMHKEDVNNIFEEWGKAVKNKEIFDCETRFKRKDGNTVLTKVKASAMIIHGEAVGYVGTVEDISERKRYESELLLAKEHAEDATKAKEDFLSTMSHELRTPLNSVIGMSHILLDESPMPHQVENLNTLRFSAENLLAIINDILDYNKIESGNLKLEYVNTDIKALIARVKNSFEYYADEKLLRLNAILDADLPAYILCDPTRLSQVLTNLINNAIKFTSKGFVRIEAILENYNSNEEEVCINFSVEDSGIGIPANKLELIFDRFSQAHDATTRIYGGTGLGLSITKNLVELMGGRISISSKINKGSKFFFKLNFKIGQSQNNIKNDIGEFKLDKNTLKGTKILLAEDNLVNQAVVTKFLHKWGAQVVMANNGLEAVEKVQQEYFDVILMDLQMPVMDGYEATKKIKSLGESFSAIPIIALTAAAVYDVQSSITKAGMDDYVSKPFVPEELQLKISKACKALEENYTFSFKKIEALAEGDNFFMQKIISSYIKEINQLKGLYQEVVIKNKKDLFPILKHKYCSSLDLLKASKIITELELTEGILHNGSNDELKNQAAKFSEMCDTLILACDNKSKSLEK
jgi:PAS domain S-box-containing protein